MCRACGEATFEDASTAPGDLPASPPATTVCPHCGFESEDDELCQACGALFEDNTPVRDISFAQIVGGFFSWLKDGLTHDPDVDYINGMYVGPGDPESAPYFLDEEIDEMFSK